MQTDLDILTQLGEISVADFLKDYWQRKPLLIRNAFPKLPDLPADELAGFALEKEVESRLIIEYPESDSPFKSRWSCHHGPLSETLFEELPDKKHWTLLVQAVNQLSEPMHHFLHRFRFLPNWRIDDVMVSYASDQGSVGPHFDYYDVFLVQAQGQRLWRLGQHCDAQTATRSDTPLRLLTQFDTAEEYLVNPGDMLYVPPGLAHWGIAQGPCMTYSVGFRAPSQAEMLEGFTNHFLHEHPKSEQHADLRLSDPGRSPALNPGEISHKDMDKAYACLQAALADRDTFEHWFGCFMTETKREEISFEPEQSGLRLAAHCLAAFIENENQHANLFINGEAFQVSKKLAQTVCAYQAIIPTDYFESEQACIDTWRDNDWLSEA